MRHGSLCTGYSTVSAKYALVFRRDEDWPHETENESWGLGEEDALLLSSLPSIPDGEDDWFQLGWEVLIDTYMLVMIAVIVLGASWAIATAAVTALVFLTVVAVHAAMQTAQHSLRQRRKTSSESPRTGPSGNR